MISDYQHITDAIGFITANSQQQPTVDEVAAHLKLSSAHFQRIFSRWAGVTPKKYLQILTVEHAKNLLNESQPLLAASDEVGLSSGSRLYDHFVQLEAVTPGEYETGGAFLSIDYEVHNSPFGDIFVAATKRGICKLSFLDQEVFTADIADLQRRWPNAVLRQNAPDSLKIIDGIFSGIGPTNRPLSLHVCGTNFQINVWRALMQIPVGALRSYSHIAKAVGSPKATRAVGSAIASNPIAFFIPCHRVLQQSGNVGGYRWGVTRKHSMHAWETA
jgi:AraC family transcriptional regulator of adaptative response/methylated-DNA-[protein]-cysteine methyltransferase